MDPCTVETGLLRKKPCGHASVAKCANCERPLCGEHAIAQLNEARKKTGTFICKECDVAQREYDKRMGTAPSKPAAAPPPAAKKPAEPAKAPAAAKAAPAEKKAEPPPVEHSGSLEFTPEPKKPDSTKK